MKTAVHHTPKTEIPARFHAWVLRLIGDRVCDDESSSLHVIESRFRLLRGRTLSLYTAISDPTGTPFLMEVAYPTQTTFVDMSNNPARQKLLAAMKQHWIMRR